MTPARARPGKRDLRWFSGEWDRWDREELVYWHSEVTVRCQDCGWAVGQIEVRIDSEDRRRVTAKKDGPQPARKAWWDAVYFRRASGFALGKDEIWYETSHARGLRERGKRVKPGSRSRADQSIHYGVPQRVRCPRCGLVQVVDEGSLNRVPEPTQTPFLANDGREIGKGKPEWRVPRVRILRRV